MQFGEIIKRYLEHIERRDELERQMKAESASILVIQQEIIEIMKSLGIDSLTHKESGKKFSIIKETNVSQSDYAKENDTEFMEEMKRRGYDIFKYSCHYQTLGATVRNEIMKDGKLPDWVNPYVIVSEFERIKLGK